MAMNTTSTPAPAHERWYRCPFPFGTEGMTFVEILMATAVLAAPLRADPYLSRSHADVRDTLAEATASQPRI